MLPVWTVAVGGGTRLRVGRADGVAGGVITCNVGVRGSVLVSCTDTVRGADAEKDPVTVGAREYDADDVARCVGVASVDTVRVSETETVVACVMVGRWDSDRVEVYEGGST